MKLTHTIGNIRYTMPHNKSYTKIVKHTQNLLHKRFQKSDIDRLYVICYHKHI